jgi:cytidylate kinase
MSARFFQIAIDGPVAAGKGTVSRLVAQELGFLYVDTGAMYRVAALLALRNKIPLDDEAKIAQLVSEVKLKMRDPIDKEKDGRLVTMIVDGEDVSWAIRTEEVSQAVSPVATLPQVRRILVKKQQKIAQSQSVVMEGRDITYKVLPRADLKIYLTANDVVRAKRRHFQLLTKGEVVEFQAVYEALLKRDERDKTRQTDPLKITPEVWVIDTSDLSIEQVVDLIVAKVKIMRGE